MKEYYVSYMCVFGTTVEANSPEEAAEIAAKECEYDIDGAACVTDLETNENFEI